MQTKKDHVHAYQTLVGRMSSALLLGDTNYSEAPARRALMGMVFGVVLALLIGVAFWVYGLINPGGNMAWKKPNAILVEKESGARFVYEQGQLVPVLNHASAMLLKGAGAKVESISRASLDALERGRPVGIPDAPDPVPPASSLMAGHWLLCLPRSGGLEVEGTGLMSMNADPDVPSAPVAGNEYLWVASPEGQQYVVWANQKLRLTDPLVPLALGLGGGKPPVAPPAWLSSLPDGPEVGPAVIPQQGKKNVTVGGTPRPVGTVVRHVAGNGAENFSVLREDGLAPMSRTEAVLLQAKNGGTAVEIGSEMLASAPHSGDDSLVKRVPDLLASKPVPAGERAFCLRQQPVGVDVASQAVTVDRLDAGFGMNERIGVRARPGTGVLAASVPAPKGPGAKPDRYLITDRGLKYRLADDDSISALGFGGVAPVPVAAGVLAQIPNGPSLSRAAVGVSGKGRG